MSATSGLRTRSCGSVWRFKPAATSIKTVSSRRTVRTSRTLVSNGNSTELFDADGLLMMTWHGIVQLSAHRSSDCSAERCQFWPKRAVAYAAQNSQKLVYQGVDSPGWTSAGDDTTSQPRIGTKRYPAVTRRSRVVRENSAGRKTRRPSRCASRSRSSATAIFSAAWGMWGIE